jgi:hypothetical protein
LQAVDGEESNMIEVNQIAHETTPARTEPTHVHELIQY